MFEGISDCVANPSDEEKWKTLLDRVVKHFQTEEKMFEIKGYAMAVDHKSVHDKFVDDALKVTLPLTEDVATFCKGWLVDHICGTDMKYVECLGADLTAQV